MKTRTTLLTICLGLFSFQFASAGQKAPLFQTNTTFERVAAKAKFENKPVMLIISSKECASFRNFKTRVLADTSVAGLYERNFLCYNIDVDTKEGKQLAYKYNAMVLPQIIYFSAGGQVIFRSHATDQPIVAIEEAQKVIKVVEIHAVVMQQALKGRNITHLNKKVQKQVAVEFAKKDAKAGKTDIENQVFEYTLNSDDLRFFKKVYVKTLNKYN